VAQVIISCDDVLLPNADSPEAAAFAAALAARLSGAEAGGSACSDAGSDASSSASLLGPAPHAKGRPAGAVYTRVMEKWRRRLATASSTLSLLLAEDEEGVAREAGSPAAAARAAALLALTRSETTHIKATPYAPHSRAWLRVGAEGGVSTVIMDKHALASRYAVPLRDLRVLDATHSGSSLGAALLCRKRAVVLSLEHVRLLLTHAEVLVPPSALASTVGFVAELSRRLAAKAAGGPTHQDPLPFEFLVLDAALEAAASGLEVSTAALEREVPACLDALGLSTLDATTLERVRKVKGLIARCAGRAAAVRDEVLRFLDDDSDMRGLYLTRKWEERRAKAAAGGVVSGAASGWASGVASPRLGGAAHLWSTAATPGGARRRGETTAAAKPGGRTRSGVATPRAAAGAAALLARLQQEGEGSGSDVSDAEGEGGGRAAVQSALALALERLAEDADVQAAEDILETYFAQLDRTCARLGVLEQLVEQTEDLVNTDLDVKQNGLIQLMLVTSFLTWVNLCYTTITGLFATMLSNFTGQGWPGDRPVRARRFRPGAHFWPYARPLAQQFYTLNAVCSAVCVLLTCAFAFTMRRLKLIGGGADVAVTRF